MSPGTNFDGGLSIAVRRESDIRQSKEYELGAQSAREDAEGASHAELQVLSRRSQTGDWGDDYDRGYRNTFNEIIR